MRKFAIKVIKGNFQVGCIGASKPGENRIRRTDGRPSDMSIRKLDSIRDTSHIPYWTTRQECYKALSRIGDAFYEEFSVSIEELR